MQLHELTGVVLVQAGLPSAIGSARNREIGLRAEPVVEVVEHRRMMGGGPHEVGELAQRVRADRLALVHRNVPAHVALAGEDVEVVEPEVDHDLLELPLARHGADHLGRLELRRDPGRPLVHRVALLHLLTRHLPARQLRAQLRIGTGVGAQELGRGHAQRRELGERCLGRGVLDLLGVELALEPKVQTERAHALDVAGTWAVGEPAQRVEDLTVAGGAQVRRRRGGRRGWSGRRRIPAGGDARRRCAAPDEDRRGQDRCPPPHRRAPGGVVPCGGGWTLRCCCRCSRSRSRSSGGIWRHRSRIRSRSSGLI